ncbi:MAG TPA: hypothetical protein VNQ90_00855 [Chthoniobacteraceae bacterium]|nr:hypothetical protein [Chthoniobacteraceae bacterium]
MKRFLILSLVLLAQAGLVAAPASAPQPALLLDFASGHLEATVAPGEKRVGRFYLGGPRADPHTERKGVHRSILEDLRNVDGRYRLVPNEPLSLDILGALNLQSGALSLVWIPGEPAEKGGVLLSVTSTFVGSPQAGPTAWELSLAASREEPGKVAFELRTGAMKGRTRPVTLAPDRAARLRVDWEATRGIGFFLNGEPLAMEENTPAGAWVDLPVERLQIHRNPTGGIEELALYSTALSVEEPPVTSPLPPATPPARTLTRLHPGIPLRLTEAVVEDAREEGLRAGGWLAVDGTAASAFPWWYHGYSQLPERRLEITLAPGSGPKAVTLTGTARGRLAPLLEDGSEGTPLALEGGNMDEAIGSARRYRLSVSEGLVHEIGFYREEAPAAAPPGPLRTFPIASGNGRAALAQMAQRELASRYHPASQRVLPAGDEEGKATLHFGPGQAWHVAIKPPGQRYPLGEIGLRLALETPLREPVALELTLHAPGVAWKELSRRTVLLQPGGDGTYQLWLDLRDTVLFEKESLWLTLCAEKELKLRTGEGGSAVTLAPAGDEQKALALWGRDRWRSVRDHFESISEPRPWAAMDEVKENAWWLRLQVPAYAAVDDGLRQLLKQFPENPLYRAVFTFTHPQMPNPATRLAVPEATPKAPRWASLLRENLKLYKEFVHWWIDHRQHPNGEFGHWYGDDSDLLQEWVNLVFISDPGGKVRESFSRLNEAIVGKYRRNGEPLIRNGLNTRYTDSLHAYEEGLNLQASDFLMNYGHPGKFARLLETVSRYDGYLLVPAGEPGRLRFAGDEGSERLFLNTDCPPTGGSLDYWAYLFTHPGLMAGWYNRDPAIWDQLAALGRWSLARRDKKWQSVGSSLLGGLYYHTREEKWLSPMIDRKAWTEKRVLLANPRLEPKLQATLPGIDRQATLGALKEMEGDGDRFEALRSTHMGDTDRRFVASWVEWKLSGEEKELHAGLEAMWRKWKFLQPVLTEAEMSGDRVAVPKNLLAYLYLGGSAGSRNADFYPNIAVSYEGWDDFSAMVLEDGPDRLRLRFYLFGDQPRQGSLRTWQLEEGDYSLTIRRGEETLSTRSLPKWQRADAVELLLPPQESLELVFTRESRSEAPAVRGDAALMPGGKGASYRDGVLRVPVYNLGCVEMKGITVLLCDGKGEPVSRAKLERLPALGEWKPGKAVVDLPVPAGLAAETLYLELETSEPEITRQNNHSTLRPDRGI